MERNYCMTSMSDYPRDLLPTQHIHRSPDTVAARFGAGASKRDHRVKKYHNKFAIQERHYTDSVSATWVSDSLLLSKPTCTF